MTGEMTEKCYQAVRCLYCSEPIPLSNRLLELCAIESDSTTIELHGLSQVFTLRCEICSKEGRYLWVEIGTFEGERPKRGVVGRAGPKRYSKSFRDAAGL